MTLRLKLMGIASIKTPPARFVLAPGDTAGTPSIGARARYGADPRSARPLAAGANPVPARRRKKLRARAGAFSFSPTGGFP